MAKYEITKQGDKFVVWVLNRKGFYNFYEYKDTEEDLNLFIKKLKEKDEVIKKYE